MLHLLDEALLTFLRVEVPLPDDVAVSFATPDREWSGSLTSPTVNLFLHDLHRSVRGLQAGWERGQTEGRPVRRRPPVRVDCHYLLTVWGDPDDQHRVLGDTLGALLVHRDLPLDRLESLGDALAGLGAPTTLDVADGDHRAFADLWTALGGQVRPGIPLVVTTPLERVAQSDLEREVDRVTTVTRPSRGPAATTGPGGRVERRHVGGRAPDALAGGRASSPRGAARVDGEGTFLVPAETGDVVVVQHEGTRRDARVPAEGPLDLREQPEG